MKLRAWIVVAAVGAGAIVMLRGTDAKAPDERLAARFDDICKIARANKTTPVDGVAALGTYLGDHLGDMAGDFGATVAEIEKIADDGAHDRRARVARDRMTMPLARCSRDLNDFADAIERDPDAMRMVERAMQRLERTFNIIIGSTDLRQLPARIDQLLTGR